MQNGQSVFFSVYPQSRSLFSASFHTFFFDCSSVLEYAKIRTVLQSRGGPGPSPGSDTVSFIQNIFPFLIGFSSPANSLQPTSADHICRRWEQDTIYTTVAMAYCPNIRLQPRFYAAARKPNCFGVDQAINFFPFIQTVLPFLISFLALIFQLVLHKRLAPSKFRRCEQYTIYAMVYYPNIQSHPHF